MICSMPILIWSGDPPILQVGQTLQLPECESSVGQPTVQTTPSLVSTVPGTTGGTQVYIVQPGDTLYGIALNFGITVQSIIDANNLLNPDRLDVGTTVNYPAAHSIADFLGLLLRQ